MPMKIKEGKGSIIDAYYIAKYGHKWVHTRIVINSLVPKWNEQYTWEVFDPCTVVTVGVFDNCHLDKNTTVGAGGLDSRIGKVRIRLLTLESDRVYTHAYPLLMLHPSGVKKMGSFIWLFNFPMLIWLMCFICTCHHCCQRCTMHSHCPSLKLSA
ncbi:hypothetical protein IFM89_030343 [Coptis chinensis]|uniref:C2 domain-containing protein n=1 Tax=Coptis chinensis TaxID=261450 RepID=A0A835IEY7_9MAGN|nr:hypothetical protein IFM89_030343 [Coptis chinensis]